MLYILYRISDKGNIKDKLPHAGKIHCLKNFLSVFGPEGFFIFADNCKSETTEGLRELGLTPFVTSLGNSKSWRYAAEYAMNNFKDDDVVYFVEDDYLHLPKSREILLEGIAIADYVSLYDPPDKYVDSDKGGNPFIHGGGENTKVLLTAGSHWKITNSTTMTFAVKIRTLREDKKIWWEFTRECCRDFPAFQRLCGIGSLKNRFLGKKRKIITPIPSLATHIELKYLAPLTDWTRI